MLPSGIWNLESGILGFGIQDTAQRIRNPTKDWNPESTDRESGIYYIEFGIHCVESRIQHYLRFPFMGH